MRTHTFYRIFKAIAFVVLILGIGAILYATYIGLSYWNGIGV